MNDLKETTTNGKSGHKILLIGEYLFYSLIQNEITRDNAEISYYNSGDFHEVDQLKNYTLCIVEYRTFSDYPPFKELFFKQMLDAIEYGVSFCVVYFDGAIDSQFLGSQILQELKLGKSYNAGKIIHNGKATKKEFSSYVKRWGSSAIAFKDINEEATALFKTDHVVLGLVMQVKNSSILFIPFLRNTSNKKDLKEGFEILIDSLLTFITSFQTDLPNWAKETPFFSEEKQLSEEKENLQKELITVESKIQVFENAKSLLLQRETKLEIFLTNFLQDKLDLKVFREEKYKEDFWLINENEERIAIAEIKSANKGFRRDMIFRVLDHKSENELSEDFPTLLFVNCNLQAGSWKDKEKLLSKDEYDFAANHDVLIIRVEDIVRLWELKRLGKITSKEILELFLTKKGWLQVTKELKIEVLPK